MGLLIAPLIVLLAIGQSLLPVQAGENGFALQEVKEGIFVHQGRHEIAAASNLGDIANIGFIVGQRCVAVIDPGGSRHVALKLKEQLRQVTDLPVCYVILTHIHPDHLLGAAVFTGPEVAVIGHENLPDLIFSNRQFFTDNFLKPYGEPSDDEVFVTPTLLVNVEQDLKIDLGQRELTITAWPVAHTHSDLSILDHQSGVGWLSDLLFVTRIPPLDGSLRGWVAASEELLQQSFSGVVPGHGPVLVNWPDAMTAQLRYLKKLLDQTRAMIAAGEFLETAQEQVAIDERSEWLLFDEVHRRNVIRAFAELEWE